MKWFLRGHEVPDLVELNEDEGFIDMSHGVGEGEILGAQDLFPRQLKLRLKIQPIPFESGDASAEALTTIAGENVTVSDAQWQGVDLLEMGQGSYTDGEGEHWFSRLVELPFLKESSIFHKSFGYGDVYATRGDYTRGKRFLVPYGGLYYPGIDPKNIQQIYGELIRRSDQTFEVGFTSYNLWRVREILPPHAGVFESKEIHFLETDGASHLSLGAALVSGEMRVTLHHPAVPEVRTYVSNAYTTPGGHPDLVDVIFF